MAINKTDAKSTNAEAVRYVLIGMLAVAAFFGAYKFAAAGSVQPATSTGATSASVAAPSAGVAVTAADTAPQASAAPVSGGSSAGAGAGSAGAGGGSCCGGAGGSAAGGCCGGSGAATTSKPLTGTAKLSGNVQTMAVKVTTSYSPNVIILKAGLPAQITFSQAQGCTGVVQSAELGFQEDLTTGPKTVKLQGLSAGTYAFACGMNMVTGTILVK